MLMTIHDAGKNRLAGLAGIPTGKALPALFVIGGLLVLGGCLAASFRGSEPGEPAGWVFLR